MKYIRTKLFGEESVWKIEPSKKLEDLFLLKKPNIVQPISTNEKGFELLGKVADTIPELCDEFVAINKETNHKELVDYFDYTNLHKYVNYGAIWTDKGLIYVAKINDKGELELL